MVEFRPVGIYAESYSKARPDLPSVRESITTVDLPDRARILDYMRAVTPSFDVLDVTVDLHDGQAKIKSGSSLVTDGVWVWRVDSVHHLAAHPLVIDEQFVAHVRARAYQAPADIEVTDEIEDALLKFF